MAVHDKESIQRRGKVQGDVAISFLVVTWFFIALRVWTRIYVISNFGWDDSTMILAGVRTFHSRTQSSYNSVLISVQALFTVYCGAMLYLDTHGGGTHVTKVADLVMLTKVGTVIRCSVIRADRRTVGHRRRSHLYCHGGGAQAIIGNLLRTHSSEALATMDHIQHSSCQHHLFSRFILLCSP